MFKSVSSLPQFLAVSALLCTGAFADTITLTTGEKVEGRIINETDADVTVEVKVSATIKDETVIPKSKIQKIDKEQPDEVAWPAVKNVKLGVNSLPAMQYETLTRPIQGFLNDFPKSAHAAEATQLLATINAEKERVEGGEVRIGQKWLTKEEVGKEHYQIGGMLTFQFQRSQRAAGDLIGSLNTFDQLEKTFPGSKSYPDGVETARETLTTLKATVDRAQQNFIAQKAEFEKGVAASSTVQKPELLAARQKELAQGEAALTAAEKTKTKWPALMVRSDRNLDYFAKKIPSELSALTRVDVAKLRQSADLATQAEKEVAKQDTAASETISKALNLWPANELAKRLQPEAVALKTAAASAKQAETAAATPVPVATPTPTPTPTPAPTPVPLRDAPPAPPEEETPFLLTIGGMITMAVVLALLVAGFLVYKKVRGKANEVLE